MSDKHQRKPGMTSTSKIFFALAFVCGSASAQTDAPVPRNNAIVYKCVGADGSVVYSQKPCSADAAKMQTIDTSGALRTGSGGHQGDAAVSAADRNCRERAYQSTHTTPSTEIDTSNGHIAKYEERKRELNAPSPYATNDTGAAAQRSGNQKEIDDLDAAIAKERAYQNTGMASTETAYQNALKSCADELAKSAKKVQDSEHP